eukprot:6212893-Pleurochrysis_carterae.AAC.2
MKHYEYFGKDEHKEDREKGTCEVPGQDRERKAQGQHGREADDDKGKKLAVETTTNQTTDKRETKAKPTKQGTGAMGARKGREEQTPEMHIGTMNISGIAYGYRGKYIRTKEELLKIRPGDKLREVTEMMKTQGISLMTLTDTHLNQEGMRDVGKFLQQEGLGGGGITARRERTEDTEYSARRRAGIYFIWDPTKIGVDGIEEVYASRVARGRIHVLHSGKELDVYGVYMPVRNNKAERTGEIWETLMQE